MTTDHKWISVESLLPEEKQYVLIWLSREGTAQVARIEKGISEVDREKMRRGLLHNPIVQVAYGSFDNGRKAPYRSSLYCGCDEHGNNKRPYRWVANGGPMTWFGQEVSHWMPLPESPNRRKNQSKGE